MVKDLESKKRKHLQAQEDKQCLDQLLQAIDRREKREQKLKDEIAKSRQREADFRGQEKVLNGRIRTDAQRGIAVLLQAEEFLNDLAYSSPGQGSQLQDQVGDVLLQQQTSRPQADPGSLWEPDVQLPELLDEIGRSQNRLSEAEEMLLSQSRKRKRLEEERHQREEQRGQNAQEFHELEKRLEGIKGKRMEKAKQLLQSLVREDPSLEESGTDMDLEQEGWQEAAAKIESRLKEAAAGLEDAFEKNRRDLQKKQHLKQEIPRKKNRLKELEALLHETGHAIVRSEEKLRGRDEKIRELSGRLPVEQKEEVQSSIRALQEQKKEREECLQAAEQEYQTYRTASERLASAVETVKNQLSKAGEAARLSEEEIWARKEEWQQKRQGLLERRDRKHTAYQTNHKIICSVKAKQEDILEVEGTYRWMKALSDTANGMLSKKQKIEFETYIQMAYFDRIIRRANLRLLTMSSGQYELKRAEFQEDPNKRESLNRKEKTGLELSVIDHYNATERSVKTLSGGETFQASLSLALGLSDEIQSNAGGIHLDSMFVDEGFGSLDEESLSQAIKALARLTQGERLVGIISHVAELKEQIEKKIVVTKSRGKEGVSSEAKVVTG